MDRVRDMAARNAAMVFSKSTCCMSYSIKKLFQDKGANPAILELDQERNEREIETALKNLGCNSAVPAVFVGGIFVGSANDVISLHVDGSLRQMLIDASALWL